MDRTTAPSIDKYIIQSQQLKLTLYKYYATNYNYYEQSWYRSFTHN